MNNKLKMAAAVAMVLGSSAAFAATEVVTTVTALEFATVTTAVQKVDIAGPVFDGAVTASAGETFVLNDVLTISLTGGAKFDASTWALEVAKVGFLADTVGNVGNTPVVTGCLLDTALITLTCNVTTGSNVAATTSTVNVSAAALYDLDAATADAALNIKVTRLDLGQNTVIFQNTGANIKNVFSVTNAIQKGGEVVSKTSEATVADKFLIFGGNSPTDEADSTAGTDFTTAVSTAGVELTDATGKYLLTVSGLPTAAESISIPTLAVQASDSAGADKTVTLGEFFLDGTGNGYGTLPAATILSLSNPFTLTVDEATAITAGDVAVGITYLAGASDVFVDHTVMAPSKAIEVTRDGSSFSVNSTGSLNTIKITDKSGSLVAGTGTVSIDAYDAAGVAVSGSLSVANLTSNSTVVISGADLKAAFVDAVRFDFTVESSSIIASNIKKTADGTSVTVYGNSANAL